VATTPILIKRYENRKLYDTTRSAYVTLEDIARMIREGKEIKVVDAKTHEDLTKNTLALIILEQERDKKSLLPLSVMYQLIKYGEAVQGAFQEYLANGFEAFLASQRDMQKRMQQWGEESGPGESSEPEREPATSSDKSLRNELEALKRKVAELQNKREPRKTRKR
jgi:polyhydroxyalkanoate synthesis repressor PhaR